MKSIFKLTRGELFKLFKSNTLYIMTGLLTAVILLMTWIYSSQEKNVTDAIEFFLGNNLSTDSFDIIDGELDELKQAGIDTSELDSFSKSLADKPQIKLLLLGVEPELLNAFIHSSDVGNANKVFADYASFSDVQSKLYYDYLRLIYDEYLFEYSLNQEILKYIVDSNYNVSFIDYINNVAMKDLFESYSKLFGKSNGYFSQDGAYYQFINLSNSITETPSQEQIILLNSKYNILINAADNFFVQLNKFTYLTDSSLLGTNYLLMPTKSIISEDYSILSEALSSISKKAEIALTSIKQQKLNNENSFAFRTELANLFKKFDENYTPNPTTPMNLPYTIPSQSETDNFRIYESFIAGLKEIAENDNVSSKNLFYAYNSEMIRKAYEYTTTQDFTPTNENKKTQELADLQTYINTFDVKFSENKLIINASLPFEKIINKSYSAVITKGIYDDYIRPYFDDSEKHKLDEMIELINQSFNSYSPAQILFYNIPSDSIAAMYPEDVRADVMSQYEGDQTLAYQNFANTYNQLKTYFKKFSARMETLDSLIKNTNFITAINANRLNDNQCKKIQGFIFTSKYNLNSYITQAQFLIKNDMESTNYSVPESLSKGYGAMEFIFILTKIIILIFGIVLASGTIAGEHSDGTMKLLLIRPHTRASVLFSKFLAVCIVLLGFYVFNFALTLLIGSIGWGLGGVQMALSIFNSKTALILHPLAVVVFLHLFGFFEAIVFSLIALTISTLFRSRSGATAVSMLVYFVSFVLDALLSTFAWYKYIIFNNTDLFIYMSSTGPTIADQNLLFSLIINIVYIAAMGIMCFFTFAKRDAN